MFGSEHKLGIAADRGRKPDVSVYLPGTRFRANAGLSRTPAALTYRLERMPLHTAQTKRAA